MQKKILLLTLFILIICVSLTAQEKPKIEVVFVLDTTGSMGNLINAAKDKIWSIATTMATSKPSPDIKMGIIGYRDRGDDYVTKFTGLTYDIDKIYSNIMDFTANGGGDTPESVNLALYEAVTKMKWSNKKDVYQVIFLVGDAPPKMNYANDVKYGKSCKLAKEKGIIINTIQYGTIEGTEKYWTEIASLAFGDYFRVSQDDSYVHFDTPYDKKLAELSEDLDKTLIYYGSKEMLKMNEKRKMNKDRINEDADYSVKAQRSYYNSTKSGLKNFIGEQELIDMVINGKVKLEEIKKDELPDKMKKMSLKEKKDYIKKISDKREKIQKEIIELNKKRQAYIKEEVKKNNKDDSFDNQIFKCLVKQTKNKNITFEDGLKY